MIAIRILSAFASVAIFVGGNVTSGADWFFMPSTYSHSPVTGHRVTQYAPIPPVIVYQRPDYTRSGYRQTRSTIRAGGSQDHYHVVEQFGNDVRPYGEWLYPNRPYAVPYDIWGPPFGGVNGEHYSDGYRSRDPRARFDRRAYDPRLRDDRYFADEYDRRLRSGRDDHYDDRRVDSRHRDYQRYNGLFDGRGIPGDDEHYLDP